MKDSLQAGISFTRKIMIDEPRTIDHLGEDLRVYSTPAMVRDIEYSCLDFLKEHTDEGEHSVGTGLSIEHTAPTPLGWEITITGTIEKVDGRHVSFDVTVNDGVDECGTCKHGRFIVLIDKVKERVIAKKAKATGN
ncbi:MAG: LysR family transcriptional regulator [Alphaproteobacteria bacterium]|jgi:predicted thioesterase|nr:LysR family transcriptional regulator [Alphaproteobacteria bacterium]